jgi:hypothetical protein
MLTGLRVQKLQRRIANFRGLPLDVLIAAPAVQPSLDEPKHEPQPATAVKVEAHDVAAVVVTKRKYRRHPKVSNGPGGDAFWNAGLS